MYNADIPTRASLPTTARIIRSTLIALATAAALLVTVVLPAEYGIDPTGIGRTLQLTDMGTIKNKLAAEAAADLKTATAVPEDTATKKQPTQVPPAPNPAVVATDSPTVAAPQPAAVRPTGTRKDEMAVTLKPDQGAEIKMQMKKGAKASYSWVIEGGVVNFDEHGDGGADSAISYEKGKGVANKAGVLEAAFDGIYGWY